MSVEIVLHCPRCNGTKIQKMGLSGSNKQRYLCTECNKRFQEPESRSCANCRNNGSKLCVEHERKKLYYERVNGHNNWEKNYCKFWAYDPNGNGIWKTHQ